MADDFEIPELPTYLEIPEINEGIMDGDGPFKSAEEFQIQLGFPGKKLRIGRKLLLIKWANLNLSIVLFKFFGCLCKMWRLY